MGTPSPTGVGLGLRWEFLDEVLDAPPLEIAFFEVSPENYIGRGGYYADALDRVRERYSVHTHGLALNLGGTDRPSPGYVAALRAEVARLDAPFHSDHLSFARVNGRALHEFFPLKRCKATVAHVAERLRAAEDALGVPMAVENVSAYVHGGHAEMSEAEFVTSVLEGSGAGLLLDVNNVYVNSRNFGFDPVEFLEGLPLQRVVEVHVAGHERQGDVLVDTHGTTVAPPVLDLLAWVVERVGPVPVLLERDNDVPPLEALLAELRAVDGVYARALAAREGRHALIA